MTLPSRVSRALALLKLPEEIQEQVNTGAIPARSAYEISKHPNADVQADLAKKAAAGELSHHQAASAVRQRQGKQKPTPRTTKQTFFAENGRSAGMPRRRWATASLSSCKVMTSSPTRAAGLPASKIERVTGGILIAEGSFGDAPALVVARFTSGS